MRWDCEYAIIGGGVAGLAMAIGLQKLGKDFTVFERSNVLKGIGAGFGLAANAMQAFEYLGLRKEVEQIGYYTDSFQILDTKGNVLVDPDAKSLSSKYNQKNFTVHRADLHLFLLSKIPSDGIQLGKKSAKIEQQNEGTLVHFEDGSSVHCRYLIVAEGVKSGIRQQLVPNSTPRYAGYTCWRAILDNTAIGLQKGTETWGPKGRFGMTPLIHNRVYWYACINSLPDNPVYRNYSVEDLLKHFRDYHAPIPQLLRQTREEDLIWNDIIDIRPLRKFAFGSIVLIGDAAHATTPNMGQGACQALEDVAVLTDEIGKDERIQEAFIRFERRRLQRTQYITETSWQIGKVAQWTNPLLTGIRNTLLRAMPAKWSQANLKKLLDTDFLTINNT